MYKHTENLLISLWRNDVEKAMLSTTCFICMFARSHEWPKQKYRASFCSLFLSSFWMLGWLSRMEVNESCWREVSLKTRTISMIKKSFWCFLNYSLHVPTKGHNSSSTCRIIETKTHFRPMVTLRQIFWSGLLAWDEFSSRLSNFFTIG